MTILMINVNYVDIKREIKYLKLALNDLLVQVKVELFFSQCNNCLFLLLMYVNNKFLKCSKECFCTSINKHWPKMNNRKLSHWCFKILLNHPNHISASEYLQWAHFFMLSLVQKACFDTLITFFFISLSWQLFSWISSISIFYVIFNLKWSEDTLEKTV